MLTAFTYGLSLAQHPDWRLGKPELAISVRSLDFAWAHALGGLAETLRGECAFAYGDTIDAREPVAPDSALDAFVVFAPAVLGPGDYLGIDVGDALPINIQGVYPIHRSELAYMREHGLEAFWNRDWDPYDVTSSARRVSRVLDAYRRTGADLPFGDPRRAHGVAMEGYYWRLTDPASGRCIVALCGVCRAPDGPWAVVALASHPPGFVRWSNAASAAAEPDGLGAAAWERDGAPVLRGSERRIAVDLGAGRAPGGGDRGPGAVAARGPGRARRRAGRPGAARSTGIRPCSAPACAARRCSAARRCRSTAGTPTWRRTGAARSRASGGGARRASATARWPRSPAAASAARWPRARSSCAPAAGSCASRPRARSCAPRPAAASGGCAGARRAGRCCSRARRRAGRAHPARARARRAPGDPALRALPRGPDGRGPAARAAGRAARGVRARRARARHAAALAGVPSGPAARHSTGLTAAPALPPSARRAASSSGSAPTSRSKRPMTAHSAFSRSAERASTGCTRASETISARPSPASRTQCANSTRTVPGSSQPANASGPSSRG